MSRARQEVIIALLDCEECGGKVSDRASACPHCGLEVAKMALGTCDECDGAISGRDNTCPHCGFPLRQKNAKESDSIPSEPHPLPSAAKLNPVGGLSTSVMLGLIALAFVRGFNILIVASLPDSSDPLRMVEISETLDGVIVLGTFVTGVLFLSWQSTVSSNARILRGDEVRGPGWAFSWFLPIGNLFMPYLAIRDAWRATVTNETWRTATPRPAFGLWWFTLISSLFLGSMARYMVASETTTLDDAVAWSSWAGVAFIAAAILCTLVVSEVSDSQNHLRSDASAAAELVNV